MARLGKMQRQHVKAQYKKLAAGGDLVSDAEKGAYQQGLSQAAQQGVAAQQQALNRASMAASAGAPVMAGAMKAGAQQMGQATADASVKASGATKQHAQALRERRTAQVEAAAERRMAQSREDLDKGVEYAFRTVEAGNVLQSAFGG